MKKFKFVVLSSILAVCMTFFMAASVFAATGTIDTLTACKSNLEISYEYESSRTDPVTAVGADGLAVPAKGKNYFIGISGGETYVTFTNNAGKEMTLEFDLSYTFTLDSNTTITFPDTTATKDASSSGNHYVYTMTEGQIVKIKFWTKNTSGLTLKITGISFYSNDDVSITFKPSGTSPDGKSTFSYKINNADITKDTPVNYSVLETMSPSSTDSNYEFKGWRTSNGDFLKADNSTNLFAVKPSEDLVVTPVFAPKTSGAYLVGANTYFYWEDAISAAVASATEGDPTTVSLIENGTLPGRTDYNKTGEYAKADTNGNMTYTLPQYVILLIPYDDANTLITDNMDQYLSSATTPGSEHRRFTMASGANIMVNGAICVGSQACRQMVGQVGPYGAIVMEKDSSITIESGGMLYAYGYIFPGDTGNGTISVDSGATVYETACIKDYPGSATTTKQVYDAGVFPMRAYSVRNVEVPMTFASGATEYAFYSIYGTMIGGAYPNYFAFLGNTSDAPFCLDAGATATKSYLDGKTLLEVNGNGSLNPLHITLKVGGLGEYPVTSESTSGFPVPSGFHIAVDNGTMTMNNDILMLEGTKLSIGSNAEIITNGYNIYVFDADDDNGAVSATDIHGTSYTNVQTDAVLDVNGKLTVNQGGGLYTSASKAQIISSAGTGIIEYSGASIEDTSVLYRYLDSTNRESKAMTAAYLLNGDGTYVATNGSATKTYPYCQECLMWLHEDHSHAVNHATNVELGNSLNMYFAFWGSNINESYYVVVSHTDWETGETTSLTFSSDLWQTTTVNESNAYVVRYPGLAAKQMSDIVTVKLFKDMGKDENGNALEDQLVDTWCNSIRHYAMRMLETYRDDATKAKLRTLIVDMLNYGAACQTHFSYDTGNLANANLSAQQLALGTADVKWSTNQYAGQSGFFANLITSSNIQFAIKPTSGTVTSSSYEFTNHWGAPRTGNLLYNENEGYYYINKLVVADARQAITLNVNGTTWTDSIESYCYRMINKDGATDAQKAVFTAFMKFADSAKLYLETKGERLP